MGGNGGKRGITEHKSKEKQETYVPHISSIDPGFRLIIPSFCVFDTGLVTGIRHIICVANKRAFLRDVCSSTESSPRGFSVYIDLILTLCNLT